MPSQDSSIAYKRAVLNCIDYLHKFGYTKQQVRLSKTYLASNREAVGVELAIGHAVPCR